MKRFVVLLGILLCANCLAVDALLITKEGKSIVGYNVSKKGESIHYRSKSGKQAAIPLAELYQVLPRFVRGHKYDPKTVNRNIKYTRKARIKFRKLRKQTQPLLDEWLAVRRQFKQLTPEAKAKMEKQIAEMFSAYDKSPKQDHDFHKLRGDLEMLRYQDLQGVFESSIDARLAQLGAEYTARNVAKLQAMAAKKMDLQQFCEVDAFANGLIALNPKDEDRKTIDGALNQARNACIRYEGKKANAAFMKKRSLSAYLKANERLDELELAVESPQARATVRAKRRKMQSLIKGYWFNLKKLEGFPISAADKEMLLNTRPWLSSANLPNPKPAALIFPAQFMPKVSFRQNTRITLRAVFCKPVKPGRLGVHIMPYGVHIVNPQATITDAHASITFSMSTLHRSSAAVGTDNLKPDAIEVSLIVLEEAGGIAHLSNPSKFKLAP